MGKSPVGRIHNGAATLRVITHVGDRLLEWARESNKNNIVVHGRALRIFSVRRNIHTRVNETLEKALYIGPEQDKCRTQIEEEARLVHLRIAQVQFGVWYKPSNSLTNEGRAFSVEYERECLRQSAAYISVVYEHKLIHIHVSTTLLATNPQTFLTSRFIQIGQRETEETNYMILVKFSCIRKLGLGYDEFGQPCEYLRGNSAPQG
jgi:RNA-dependent RNA polymerase